MEIAEETVERGAQRRKRNAGERRASLENRNGVDVRPNHVRAKPYGLVQRGAAAHHRVENRQSLQTAGGVVVGKLGGGRELLEDGAERGTAAARPPLVKVGVRPEQVLVEHFPPRQAINELFGELPVHSVAGLARLAARHAIGGRRRQQVENRLVGFCGETWRGQGLRSIGTARRPPTTVGSSTFKLVHDSGPYG